MERTAIQKALTSPYGTFEWNDNYGLFTPNEGEFLPVLIHINYKDVEPRLMDQVKAYLAEHAKTPPIILFTYGEKFANVASLIAKWEREGFANNFNGIFSITHTKMGWTKSYGTLYDNIPADWEFHLNIQYTGKVVGYGSKLAEAIGSITNKPAVSLNLPGLMLDMQKLISTLDYLPPLPDTYNYTQWINSVVVLPHEQRGVICGCCGRSRGPLAFFTELSAHVCPVCLNKIKKKGPVKLEHLLNVQHDLEMERSTTRQANYMKQVKQAGMYRCPHCNSVLSPDTGNKYMCLCGARFFIVGKRILEVRIVHKIKYVYSYSVRNTGTVTLLGVEPTHRDNSPVAECYICKADATGWQWWNDKYGVPRRVCPTCMNKSSNSFTTRR